MARATERPFGVPFAAGWAAIVSVLLFLRAVGGGLFAALAVSPGSKLVGWYWPRCSCWSAPRCW